MSWREILKKSFLPKAPHPRSPAEIAASRRTMREVYDEFSALDLAKPPEPLPDLPIIQNADPSGPWEPLQPSDPAAKPILD